MKFSIFLMVLLPLYLNLKACCNDLEGDDYHSKIPFINNSNDTLLVFETWNCYVLSAPDFVRDKLDKKQIIMPGDTSITALYSGMSWEEIFSNIKFAYNEDTIWVFVFNANKIDMKSDNVDAAFLARYGVTLKEMPELNWQLSYPPDSILSVTENPDLAKDPDVYPTP